MNFGMNAVARAGMLTFFLGVIPSVGHAGENVIESRTATVDGMTLHYLIAGHGPQIILLHGFAETSRMWRPIIPLLAKHHTVIAPDLPGLGDSAIPSEGYDMMTTAVHIHNLVLSLGTSKTEIAGHDLGLMVAYAYAAQFPSEVKKLAVMDAFLPGVVGWEAIYNDPALWHFRFHGPTPEALVQGRERLYFDYFWNDLAADKNHSLSEADREAYTSAYASPGRLHAGWAYFAAWDKTAQEFSGLAQTKLTMPVLSIGGDHSLGVALGNQMRAVATDVTVMVLKNSGHWIMEEQPQSTIAALVKFLS